MKRVNISIGEDIHRKAKVIAVLRGISLNDYLESAIVDALKKESQVLSRLK